MHTDEEFKEVLTQAFGDLLAEPSVVKKFAGKVRKILAAKNNIATSLEMDVIRKHVVFAKKEDGDWQDLTAGEICSLINEKYYNEKLYLKSFTAGRILSSFASRKSIHSGRMKYAIVKLVADVESYTEKKAKKKKKLKTK